MNKDLTIEELEKYAKGKVKSMPFDIEKEMARQLIACMHRESKAKAIIRREAAKERQRLDVLVSAAQAVIERWDSPVWKDLPATADYIHKLRNAVGAYQVQCEYSGVKDNG